MKIEAAKRLKAHNGKIAHEGNVLMLGFGGVGQTMLPLMLRHFTTHPKNIRVVEKDDHTELFAEKYGSTGVHYEILTVTRDNLHEVLSVLSAGDLLVNLSTDIDGIELVEWCLQQGVMYIDTSIERWPDEPDETLPDLAERTLYHTHQAIREMASNYPGSATCVVTHGANPGLVTYFVKAALLDIAKAQGLNVYPQNKDEWAELAKDLEVKVIHIAERDTQLMDKPKEVNEFVNTWSCHGFWAEGRAPAELGWGTHENKLPYGGNEHDEGPQNAIYLSQPSVSVLLKSWVPKGGAYNGFCVQHSESVTLSEYLTTSDGSYRPSVYYVYCPCDAAVASVHEFRGRELDMQAHTRVAKTEIVSGRDELGVLLLGHKLKAWFFGSQLDIEEANRLLPGEGPTTIQVGAALLGAIAWMVENPNEGYCEPEDLPHEFVLSRAMPYLGPVVSTQSDWSPHQDRNTLFPNDVDADHPWTFANFQISS